MECKKCKSPGTIVLRKTDCYCEICFITHVNHKFRACIGKNKILSANENVLVCLSGGVGSTVLLNLIHKGISMESNKKLRINPFFVHILGTEGKENRNLAENILQKCMEYNFDVYFLHISEYMVPNITLPASNTIPLLKEDVMGQFSAMIDTMPATASNDFVPRMKQNLFVKAAQNLHCKFVFTAETTTTLAIKLLSNLAIGRGSQVENDVGFCDSKNEHIRILRPMKDVTQEELDQYLNFTNLASSCRKKKEVNCSLQFVIGEFVSNLQGNFPATISTVCKTADKIGVHDDQEQAQKCILCKSNLITKNMKLTALEATKFSRIVSGGKRQNRQDLSNIQNHIAYMEEKMDQALFPYIHKRLCYSCSRNYSKVNKCNIPSHIQMLIQN